MNRKHLMFLFFIGQLIVGFVLLFNPIPFEIILRIFGILLVAISPLWLVMFRLERVIKQKEATKDGL